MNFFLESSRLKFRHWTEADLPLATLLWGDAAVMYYIGGQLSPEECKSKLQVELGRQSRLGVQYWPVFYRDSDEFVGCAGLRPFHQEPDVYEMGAHIRRPFWGDRIGEEATRAVMQYAFGQLRAVALTVAHNPDNLHSRALVDRLGFTFTHKEPWGPSDILHPFYRLSAPSLIA